MNDDTEKKFEEIAKRTIDSAGAVLCSVEDYIEGLRLVGDEVQSAIAAAEEDAKL